MWTGGLPREPFHMDGGVAPRAQAGGVLRDARPQEKREVKYVVRAPDSNNRGRWVTVGVAFDRKNGEDGFSVKLNTLPVGQWDGTLVLLPPLVSEGDGPPEE
jgi:hypothetical protein